MRSKTDYSILRDQNASQAKLEDSSTRVSDLGRRLVQLQVGTHPSEL